MPQNSETRIIKSNTLEEFRQKSNDISLDVGDNKLIDARILDKTISFTAAASQILFESGTMRYEYKSDETLDDTTHSISNPVGRVRVYSQGTELTQALSGSNTFKTPLYVANIALTGSPTLTKFVENAIVYQAASNQTDMTASAVTFQGKILSASVADGLRLKSDSGTYNANAVLRVHVGSGGGSASTNTITAAQHTSKTTIDGTYGRIIQLNNAASNGHVIKVVSHSLVDAINEVQDDVGDITSLNTNTSADIVASINELEVGIRGTSNQLVAANLTTTANDLTGAVNELDSAQGNVALINDEAGYSATTVVGGITELQDHLGTKASLTTTAKGDLVLAINEVDANADASAKLVSSSTQTFNSNLVFGTSGKTFTFNQNTTLDLSQASLVIGGGGENLAFNTAFLAVTANDNSNSAVNRLGLEVRRAGSGADAKLQWNEVDQVGSNPERAWQLVGLNDSGNASQTADIVTFYNAKELISSATQAGTNGIQAIWTATGNAANGSGSFDFTFTKDPTVTFSGGDVTGNFTLTNLADASNVALTIGAGVVENSMLAGSIAASKLAGSIGNSLLSNSSVSLDADSGTTNPVSLGETLTLAGTSGEVTTAVSGNTVTFGLPNDVVVGNDLTVTGDLIVQGDTVTLNTSTLQVEDTLVLMGSSGTLPTTGGFGLETRLFSGRANQTIDARQWSAAGKHPNAASNVTGSHSIVFNFAYDPGGGNPKGRWEMDGSPLLSSATAGAPQIEGQNFSTGDNLIFAAGAGLTETVTNSSGTNTVTYVNADKGSDQLFYRTFTADSGGSAVAATNQDAISISGGTALNSVRSGDTITINHDDTSSQGSLNSQSGNSFIQNIVLDTHGHITSMTANSVGSLDNYQSWSIDADSGASEPITSGDTVQFIGGTGLTTSRSGNNITTTLNNTSVSAGSYGGSLKLNSFTVDAQGRLTAAANGSTISGTGLIGVAANGTISTTADNYSYWQLNVGSTSNQFSSTEQMAVVAGTGISVSLGGAGNQTLTISNTSTNTDTNSIAQFSADSGIATNYGGNGNQGPLKLQGGTGIVTSISGNTVNIEQNLNELTTTSTPGNADFFAVVNSAGSQFKQTPASIPISIFNNDRNYTSNTGDITAVNQYAGNGITAGGTQGNVNLAMTGSYTGNFGVTGEISASGDIIAFASDDRLKTKKGNIEGALSKVSQLNGFHYNWNEVASDLGDEFDSNRDMVGVSAQEVEKVLPEVVVDAPVDSKYKTVQYEKLVPLLIEAIKELNAEIEELKSINKKV